MAETQVILDLYEIMNDGRAGIPNRLRAAVAASRVERLSMPGESEPPAIVFLRSVVASEHEGLMFRYDLRREAAQGLAYWERRCKRAALQFAVPDADEKRRAWLRIINGGLRAHLTTRGSWPARKDVLLTDTDEIDVASLPDPDLVLSALLLGGNRQQRRQRQKAIDEPVAATWSGTEEQRIETIRPLAKAVHRRLAEFGLAH